MGKIIHVSVSGILKKQNQFFLVKRSVEQRYFPGYWCFPGGKVSKEDGSDDDRYYRTLVRELKEELDVDISRYDCKRIDTTTTPEFAPYRFENHFFLIEVDDEITIKLDGEHSDSKWIDSKDIESFFQDPKCLTIPPIPFYLNALSNKLVLAYESKYLDQEKEILVAQYLPDVVFYMVPSKALPPSKHTNVLLIGQDAKLLIDPSPKNEEHVDLLINEFKNKKIKFIFISHWHPDHHEFASVFSTELKAPLLMSKATLENILEHWGNDYFQGVDIKIIEAKGHIELSGTRYQVKAHYGHANGQLGLSPLDKSWVFVSDVFQGTGSVVVENMNDYINCLNDLIAYPDETIFIPSHGFPVGGNFHLKRLLFHRLDREKQVESYLLLGLDEDQIFEKIYPDLDNAMKRYALKNIRGHIQRIQGNLTSNS